MRLINCMSKSLEEYFSEESSPPYAILSHTWDDHEISFTDMAEADVRERKGFKKIELSCQQAIRDRLDYVWVDT